MISNPDAECRRERSLRFYLDSLGMGLEIITYPQSAVSLAKIPNNRSLYQNRGIIYWVHNTSLKKFYHLYHILLSFAERIII